MMRWSAPLESLFLVLVLVVGSCACGPGSAARGDEMENHLEDMRRQVLDRSIDVNRREALALEMAATLDRAAQASTTVEARAARWNEAIALLDRFTVDNPGHSREREFQFQAGVYLWARARGRQRQFELDPTDQAARTDAVRDLDEVVRRLRLVHEGVAPGVNELLEENVRFRLAQALSDRAELEPAGSPPSVQARDEALKLLDRPIAEPVLRGYADLLRAELLASLDRLDAALAAVDAASKATPAPPPADVLAARIAILSGRKRFDEAIQAIDKAALEPAVKDALALQTLLAQRASLAPGADRSALDTELFRRVAGVRKGGGVAEREALINLRVGSTRPIPARGPRRSKRWPRGRWRWESSIGRGSSWPARRIGPRSWAIPLGPLSFAFGRGPTGSRPAGTTGSSDSCPACATIPGRDPRARSGHASHPGAGPGPGRGAAGKLARRVRRSPRVPDPRLPRRRRHRRGPMAPGQAPPGRVAARRCAALWSLVRPGAARWVEACQSIARLDQQEIDQARIVDDRPRLLSRFDDARAYLIQAMSRARDDMARTDLALALIRLDLTPRVGRPDEARQRREELQHVASRPDQRDRARRLRILALAELNRYLEAEKAAREEADRSPTAELVELARLLDHNAAETESDLRMRNGGLIIRGLLAHALENPSELPENVVAEIRLRLCRALLFSGNDAAARRTLMAWNGRPPEDDDAFLRDLADSYFRLDAFAMAIEVERLRLKRLTSGSPLWFEARYRLALAEYRNGQPRDALHLIDATAILHPDLGGGQLHDRFLRLRQRIGH